MIICHYLLTLPYRNSKPRINAISRMDKCAKAYAFPL